MQLLKTDNFDQVLTVYAQNIFYISLWAYLFEMIDCLVYFQLQNINYLSHPRFLGFPHNISINTLKSLGSIHRDFGFSYKYQITF